MKTIHPAIAGHVMEENEKLRGLLREFCERVERGEVRSKSTYAKFRDALSQQAGPQKSCKWTRDDATGAYETACGVTWHLSDGGEPEEHCQYFCHHCGKRIDDEGAGHE